MEYDGRKFSKKNHMLINFLNSNYVQSPATMDNMQVNILFSRIHSLNSIFYSDKVDNVQTSALTDVCWGCHVWVPVDKLGLKGSEPQIHNKKVKFVQVH